MVPTQQNLFWPILDVLHKYPTGLPLQALYERVKTYYPTLRSEDYEARTGKHKSNAWQLQIRFAKKKMEHNHRWLVKNLSPGMCQLSVRGQKEWAALSEKNWTPRFYVKKGNVNA